MAKIPSHEKKNMVTLLSEFLELYQKYFCGKNQHKLMKQP